MTIDFNNAIDEIYSMFSAEWLANSMSVADINYVPEIRLEGLENPNKPDASKLWARFSWQILDESQNSLKNSNSVQLYSILGIVAIQIFGPRSDDQSFDKIMSLAKMTRNLFRGHSISDNIWFKPKISKQSPGVIGRAENRQ